MLGNHDSILQWLSKDGLAAYEADPTPHFLYHDDDGHHAFGFLSQLLKCIKESGSELFEPLLRLLFDLSAPPDESVQRVSFTAALGEVTTLAYGPYVCTDV
jgi:hypothetical protein